MKRLKTNEFLDEQVKNSAILRKRADACCARITVADLTLTRVCMLFVQISKRPQSIPFKQQHIVADHRFAKLRQPSIFICPAASFEATAEQR